MFVTPPVIRIPGNKEGSIIFSKYDFEYSIPFDQHRLIFKDLLFFHGHQIDILKHSHIGRV